MGNPGQHRTFPGSRGTSRNVLTTLNCSALVPVIIPRAGAGGRGGRGR